MTIDTAIVKCDGMAGLHDTHAPIMFEVEAWQQQQNLTEYDIAQQCPICILRGEIASVKADSAHNLQLLLERFVAVDKVCGVAIDSVTAHAAHSNAYLSGLERAGTELAPMLDWWKKTVQVEEALQREPTDIAGNPVQP